MTYLEKFIQDHPDPEVFKKWFGNIEDVIKNSCPSSWGYEDCEREKCNPHSYCKACWNRDIPSYVRCPNCGAPMDIRSVDKDSDA